MTFATTCAWVKLLLEWTIDSFFALTSACVSIEEFFWRAYLHPGTHTAAGFGIESFVLGTCSLVVTLTLAFIEVELVKWWALLFEASAAACVDVIVLAVWTGWSLWRTQT